MSDADLARAAVDLGLVDATEALDALAGGGDLLARWTDELGLSSAEVQALVDQAEARSAPLAEDTVDLNLGPVAPPVERPRYEPTDELLGLGGMGRVEAVLDRSLERVVARKSLLAGASRERFLAEARVTGQLEHPGIVPVYEVGASADGTPWYTMRRIAGRTLREALTACHDPDERMALFGHVLETARILTYAHSRGVVHRDVKPDNIMIGPLGETLLVDWGVAAQASDEGERVGTPGYMSPEQAAGRVDSRADTYALGVVLRELLTGDRARPAIEPADLAALCERCLEPLAARPDAAELLDELTSWRDGRRLRSYRYGPAERAVHFARTQPFLFTASVALMVITLGGGAALWSASREADAQARDARQALAIALVEKAIRANDAGDQLGAAVFAAGALELEPQDPVPALSTIWAAQELQAARFEGTIPVPAPAGGLGGGRAVAWADDELAVLGSDGHLWVGDEVFPVPPMGRTRGDLARYGTAIIWVAGGEVGSTEGAIEPAPGFVTSVAADGAHLALAGRVDRRPAVILDGEWTFPEGGFIEDLALTRGGDLVLLQGGSTVQRPGIWTAELPVGASALAVTHDHVLVVSRSLPTLWRLDLETGALLDAVSLDHAAMDVVVSDDLLAVGGEDGTTTLLDPDTLAVRQQLVASPGGASRLAVGRGRLAAGGTTDTVRVWRVSEAGLRVAATAGVRGISPNGPLLAVSADELIWLDPATLEETQRRRYGGASVAAQGEVWAVSGPHGRVDVADRTNRQVPDDRGTPFGRWAPSFSPDGAFLAVPGFDQDIALMEPGGEWTSLGAHDEQLYGVVFSPDGRLAAHGFGGQLAVWTLDGDRTDLIGHEGLVSAAAFAPDGLLASGQGDGTVRIWTDPPRVLEHHTGWVNALAWSDDSQTLVSGSDDGTAAIWDQDGTLLRVIRAQGDVDGARFDDTALILVEGGRVVRHVDARPASVPSLADAERAAGVRLDGIELVADSQE
ncbi:MAG TPA: serine/threonine-protein kinase [Myxococcota bacterium]|nr:serine/threonine-protein kinase [Myxococcota bacterium]